MAHVIDLSAYREKKKLCEQHHAETMPRPRIVKEEIWSRNFGDFGDIVYGILKIREILGYHLHYYEDWKHYCLSVLDIAYSTSGLERRLLMSETVALMKEFLYGETTPQNSEDLAMVVLILELIEKTPALGDSLPQ